MFSWGWDSGFAREQSGIRDFNPSFRVPLKPWSSRRHFFFLALCFPVTHDRLSEKGLPPKLAKTTSWQKRTYIAYSCVRGNGFIQEIEILSPTFKEREDAQSCPSFEYGKEPAIFLKLIRGQKKRKQ